MAKKRKKTLKLIYAIVVLILAAISYFVVEPVIHPDADCYVDFIDCGQGDSSLIVSDGSATLIDATTGENGSDVVAHLQKRGIKKIDHFVLTHPHEDHIGGAVAVLEAVEVENIYMMRPTKGTEPTTSVYLNLLKKIRSLGKKVHTVEVGESFVCGSAVFEVLGPVEGYEDLNDQSVILRGVIGSVSFLFTGDQETSAERDLVEKYGDSLNSTVLKVGHHGSSGSSSKAFLNAVSPMYAVISCEDGNSYGHPHKEALKRLEKINASVYRTDLNGTITMTTDGANVKVTVER